MYKFFQWLPDFVSRIDGEGEYAQFGEYYRDFLIESGICGSVITWGLIVTLIVVSLYYFIGCNKWHAVANRPIWGVVLLLTCGITFLMTYNSVLGNYDEKKEHLSGVYAVALNNDNGTWQRLRKGIEDEEHLSRIDRVRDAYIEQFRNGSEKLPIEMGLAVSLFTLIEFFGFSIWFKRYTRHGAGVPF